jgi:hypothetical protein
MPKVRPIDATDEALLVGTCKEFLPESEGRAGGSLGVAVTPEAAGHLLTGGGDQKVVGLVRPEDGAERDVYVVLTLLLLCCSCPCNSFSASIAN